MAIKVTKAEKKLIYNKKLCSLLDEYKQVIIAVTDNIKLVPSHNSFFQWLNIPTKINKDVVEITSLDKLIKKGDRASPPQGSF